MPASRRSITTRSVKKLTVFLMGSILAAPVQAQGAPRGSLPAGTAAALDREITRALTELEIPGLAIAIVRNDSTLLVKGYGVRELGKPEPVDEHTVFDIASLTKSFTSAAAAILVDRGVLRWDDPVRRYLPDLVLPDSQLTREASLRDFLSHRSGLDPANMMWVPTAVDRDEVLRRMRYLRVRAPLRQTWIYSNIGYTVAGEAMARAAGTTFEALLRDLLIRPLGLTSTTWTYEMAATRENVASPHARIAGRQQPIGREKQRQPIAAAAAVQSSAEDLARWMRFQLGNGVLDGVRFVSDSSLRETHTIQVRILATAAMRAARFVEDSTRTGYAMGWQVMDYRGHPLHWHTGNGDGQVAYMALLPREHVGVAVLVNTWSAPFVHGALLYRIMDACLGYAPRDWISETRRRQVEMARAQDSTASEVDAMRSRERPPLPLAAFAGRYDEPLFGPVFVRVERSGLTFQMGAGQLADLEYQGGRTFYLRWRDPLFREYYGTQVTFEGPGDAIDAFRTRINRDEFRATRSRP